MRAAYIFIQSEAKDPRTVLPALRSISGVKQAHALVGPTDFIAYVEGADQAEVVETLLHIRNIEGVARTDTHFVILD